MQTGYTRIRAPKGPFSLMIKVYKQVLPAVYRQLSYWKRRAEQIPNAELRKQALASIESKKFHCEGGAIYALLAHPAKFDKVIEFIVAYQTISDYLDNLCDRSSQVDADNFRQLHLAMYDAISGNKGDESYYQYQIERDDGGYLDELVRVCQRVLQELPSIEGYQFSMLTLCQLYCDLQVYKHIEQDKREETLIEWYSQHQETFPQLNWYEFAAATGSTLAIFYYAAISSHSFSSEVLDAQILESYFPYVQGIHILFDYLIDQEEDKREGDLNFCFYYSSRAEQLHRLEWFLKRALDSVEKLPHAQFHKMLIEGIVGIYAADKKVKKQHDVQYIVKNLLKKNSKSIRFFYWNGWLIHRYGRRL